MDQPEHTGGRGTVEWIAHRGAKRELPENTLPAFRRAFELGAAAIELDVHGTADGVVVVHHDAEIRAGGFRARPIANLPWAELERVELAPGVGVPRLADVLAMVPSGRTVYVEVKGSGIEPLVAAEIRATTTSCAVHSFDHAAIARMRRIAPEIPRGILFEHAGLDVRSAMGATGARDVWPQWKLIDAALLAAVHDAGGRVIAWTVNSPSDATRLAALGADGLCGDDVRVFASIGA
jgi:glycerophosphoryl diester phosphodiesterase